MKKLIAVVVALVGCVSLAADLRWVKWDGDFNTGTAANWEPAQVPQAGDNLTIYYGGDGTKYVHNTLDIEYGKVTVIITNTSSTRIDFDKNELRVTDGFSFLGNGGTVYFRTSLSGTGEFLMDCQDSTLYLTVSPVSGRTYSGNFMLKKGTLNANAEGVLGSKESHGTITILANASTAGQYGKLTMGGSWSVWNDIYYDNTSSAFALYPTRTTPMYGDVYFTGGNGTFQAAGDSTMPMPCYGKWIKWTPEGRTTLDNTIRMHVTKAGVVFYGGFEDESHAMELWEDANDKVTLACDVNLPYGVTFIGNTGAGTLAFARDNVSEDPLKLTLKSKSIVDLGGTEQSIGDITAVAGATFTDTVGGGEVVWTPSADAAFIPSLTGNMSFALDADGLTATLGSQELSGTVAAKAGTLVVAADAELPNVTGWSVAANATLDIRSSAVSDKGVLQLSEQGTLSLAQGVVLKVFKAFVGETRLASGDYTYGQGTLRVQNPLYTWTGEAGDGDLNNPANWNYHELPNAEEEALISAADPLTLHGTLAASKLTLGDGTAITLAAGSVISAGAYDFGEGTSIVSESAVLEFTGSGSYSDLPIRKGVDIRVSAGAALELTSSPRFEDGVLWLDEDGTLSLAQGVVFTVFKAFVGETRLGTGDYDYGEGILRVNPVYTWTGEAGDGDLANPVNWYYHELPTGEKAVLSATEPLELHGALSAGGLTIGEGTKITLGRGSVLSAAAYDFGTGALISSESAVLEFTGDGTYSDIPIGKDIVIRVAGATVTFASDTIGGGALHLEADDEDAVAVASGLTLPVYTYKVGDTYVDPGTMPAGAGHLAVYTKPSDPAAEWSVWTGGAGEDDRSIFTDANWDGGTAPDLLSGNAKLRFPADSVVEIAEGAVARAYALDVQGALTMSGTGKLAIGAGGATVQTAEVTIEPSVEFTEVPQTWNLVGTPKVTFNGSLGAHDGLPQDGKVFFLGNGDAKVKNGMGNVWFMAKCAEMMNAEVVVSNVLADIRHGEAFGRERGLTLWSKGYDFTGNGCHLFMGGLEVEFPVRFYGHRKEFVDTTNPTYGILTFNEPVWFYCDPDVSKTVAVSYTNRRKLTFNAPVTVNGELNSIGNFGAGVDQGTFFYDKVTVETANRIYVAGGSGWTHFMKGGYSVGDLFAINVECGIECGDENVFDPNHQILFYKPNTRIELNGHDQTTTHLWANFTSTTDSPVFNSTGGVAVVHLTNPSNGANYPFRFTGKAGLELQLAANRTLNFYYGTSLTKGPLILRGGTLNFTGSAKWHGRCVVEIDSWAKIVTSEAETFGDATDGCNVGLQIAEGGTLELGANETVRYLTVGGKDMEPGTYGASGSGAQYEMSCFTGTGILTVTSVEHPGVMLIVR